MPTPSKPITLITKHMSKEERKAREEAEKELVSGQRMSEWPEVRKNKVAHKHFKRLAPLYEAIGKDDALIEPVINRYCLLQAECLAFQDDDRRLRERLDQLDAQQEVLEYTEYIRLVLELEKQIAANDTKLQAKRKMLLDIERETLMTLKAQMAAIPKKQEEKPVSNKFLMSGTHG